MPQIVLTEDQARILTEANGPVDVRDDHGRLIASLRLLDQADIEAIERFKRRPTNREPGVTSEQRQAHFRRLEEISQTEQLDQAKVHDLLRRMRAGEDV
jgi:hypothetical protein